MLHPVGCIKDTALVDIPMPIELCRFVSKCPSKEETLVTRHKPMIEPLPK